MVAGTGKIEFLLISHSLMKKTLIVDPYKTVEDIFIYLISAGGDDQISPKISWIVSTRGA